MKVRNVVWPILILGALSLAGACSSDGDGDGGSGGSGATGGDAEGGGDGNGTSGQDTGGSNNTSGSSSGGASDGGAGGEAVAGGSTGGAAAGAGPDLCAGKALTCEDDDNPCTEDECNPETGQCGIPRTGTSCDDGMFCNGDDTCDEGECTEHEGDPCNGQTCNEGDDVCECTKDEDCPADMPGAWSECVYANTCVETGTHNRPVTTFSCESGACVQDSAVENEQCTRDTDTLACEDDGNRCNGTESCKAGNCTSQGSAGDPCKGNVAKPFCYTAGEQCRECKDAATGCGGGEECCKGVCQPEASTCSIIATIINPTVINPTVIQTISAP